MAKAMTFQTAFNRGELDPALFGRSDWQSYFSGAKKLRNMICRTPGGAIKRGGLRLVVEALDQNKPSVLIRFQYSVEQVYLLEFSDYRFRVLMDGGTVAYPEGYEIDGVDVGGQDVIIATPYSAEHMRRVRVTQKEDILIMTHPDFRPRTLIRKGDHHLWELSYLTFGSDIEPPASLRLTKDGNNSVKYKVAAIAANNEESVPSEYVQCKQGTGLGVPVPDYDQLTIQHCRELWVATYGQKWPPEWDVWNMTATQQISGYAGSGGFLSPYLKYRWDIYDASSGIATMYRPNGVKFGYNLSNQNVAAWRNEAVYGMNQGWGGILQTMRDRIRDYVEAYNEEAAITNHSILEWDPVESAERYRIYRSSTVDGQEVFYHVGETTGTTFDDDNLSFASSETPQVSTKLFDSEGNYPGVCAFFEQRLYLGRTNKQPNTFWGSRVGAWRNFNRNDTGEDEEGNPTGTISDTSSFEFTIDARDVNEILWMEPMSDILAATAGGEFTISGGNYIVTATNVSAKRQSNYGCSSVEPVVVGQSIIGVGANNRMLKSFKWDLSGDGYAGKDISHFAGHLFRRRRVGMIAFQRPPESIIWTVMSDGALLSCTILAEEEVLSWSRHDTDGKFEAVVNMIGLDGEDDMYFLVAREVNGETKRFIEQMQNPLEDGDDVLDGWYLDCALDYQGEPRQEFPGLSHLEGKKVSCFADGNVFENLVVENGTVALPVEVSRAVIGLPYTAELETMELEMLNGGGFISHAKRRPVMASILFYNTRECLYGSPDNPDAVKFGPSSPLQPHTVRKTVKIPATSGGWAGGLWLASPSPVPFGVLSLAVEMSVGGMAPGSGKALSA